MGWPEFLSGLSDKDDRAQDRVLIIDDDVEVLASLEDFLENKGFEVKTADDGLRGLKAYYSENPDIVITDLIMPGISGIEMLEKIRAHDLDTEIIVLTGQRDLDMALKALKNQASDFLLKPLDLDLLLMRMDKALNRSRLKKEVKERTRQLEQLLKDVDSSKKYMETIVRNSPHAMLSYGTDGKIQSWNDEAERITGYTREEASGKSLKNLLLLQENLIDHKTILAGEEHKNVIGQIMTKNQDIRYVSRYANVLLNNENQFAGGVESFVDITDNLENRRLLEKHLLQVRSINEIGKRIASSTTMNKLVEYICNHLVKTFFESAQVSISLHDSEKDRLILKASAGNYSTKLREQVNVGDKIPAAAGIIINTYEQGKSHFFADLLKKDPSEGTLLPNARSEYSFPVRSKNAIFGVLNIENTEKAELDESDIAMLEALSEYIGISAERVDLLERITRQNTKLAEQAKVLQEALNEVETQKQVIEEQNRKFVEELNKAAEFQISLLPDHFPQFPGISFTPSYTPSSQLGGDFYDVFELAEDKIGFVLADASGHGVTAAMLSAMFKMTLQKYAPDLEDPASVLSKLNHDFCNVLQMGEFFTAVYAIYNCKTRELFYCNAAHPYPLLLDYDSGEIEKLDTDGFLLGVMENGISFETKCKTIPDRARLVIYTDGLTEAANDTGALYGDLRLLNDLKHLRQLPAAEFISSVLKDLSQYTGNDIFEDDITMLVVDITKD